MQNPLQEVLSHFQKKKQPTDPQLEDAYQHLKAQLPSVPPGQHPASEDQLRSWFRMCINQGMKIAAEQNPHLMRTARLETYNLCPDCLTRAQTSQHEQEKPNPYQLHIDYMQQKRVTQDVLRQREERSLRKTILTDVPTDRSLPPIPRHIAHEIQQANQLDISEVPTGGIMPRVEDLSWMNSTPVEMPVVDEQEGATETGLPAFAAYLKHVSKRTA